LLVIAAAWMVCAGSPAGAQEPKEEGGTQAYASDPSTHVTFSQKTTVLKRGTFADADEENSLANYYVKDFFPRFTQSKFWSRNPPRSDLIRDLRNDLAMAAKGTDGQQVYESLSKLTLEHMHRMAKAEAKHYHPATRVNAMLMIGELNVPAAVPVLVETVQDAKQLDAVRVAAMVGLIRHANLDLVGISDPAMLLSVVAAMTAIAEKPVPEDDSADGRNWIRAQAAEVLGLLGSAGNNAAAAKALGTMVRDTKLPPAQRCRAAHALGRLSYDGAAIAAGPYLEALGGLAQQALTDEQKGSPNSRRLKGCLHDILAGIQGADDQHTGIGGLAKTAAEQAQRDGLLRVLVPVYESLNDVNLAPAVLATKVDDALQALSPLVKAR
jgi:hypothetical protein